VGFAQANIHAPLVFQALTECEELLFGGTSLVEFLDQSHNTGVLACCTCWLSTGRVIGNGFPLFIPTQFPLVSNNHQGIECFCGQKMDAKTKLLV
jgi:hypothetical protein